MTEFKRETRTQGNVLYGKKQSVFIILYKLHNYFWSAVTRTMTTLRRWNDVC